ncbi:MAG: hypothetical protein ACO3Y3_11250 [Phycisphaerales bacterium]
MAVYQITHKYLLDDYAVVQLLTPGELDVGQSMTIAGVDATFNGTYTIWALPQYLYTGTDTEGDLLYDVDVPIANQVLYARTAADVERQATAGTLTYTPTCTWVSAADVTAWLNITPANANDTALITQAASAGSQFCWRRRAEAGYVDSLTTVPSADVKLGTIMYAGALYRARGSLGDSFASFDTMGAGPIIGMSSQVKQLLGVDRPAIA